MPAFVSTPVVAYSTTAAWIAAPAIGPADFAWLEVERANGDSRVVAGFRGDRLVVRTKGANTTVVDQPCTTLPCGTVQAPVGNGDGSFTYAVAFPGTGGYVATVSGAGLSNVVAEDQTDPREITSPHPVTSAGGTVVWVDGNAILSAPAAGGTATTLVTAEQAGGTITSIAASAAGVAWSVRPTAGGTAVAVRSPAGEIATRATEPDTAAATLYSVALADDGTLIAMRRSVAKGRQTIQAMAYAADGSARALLTSVPFGKRDPFEVTRPAVTGTRVAVRLRGGPSGSRDEIWIVDLATGASGRIAAVERREARLTDPAFGVGRVVWARDDVAGSRLVRARVFSAALKG